MKSKKILIPTLAVALVASLGIGTSLAYLTDKDDAKNTFTVGEVVIDLDEPQWDDETDGKDMVPGTTVYKDPIVTCDENSQDSYMRVKMVIKDSTTDEVITDADRYELILSTIKYDENKTLEEGTKYSSTDLANLPMVNTTLYTIPETITNLGDTVPEAVYFNYKEIFKANDEAPLFTTIVVPTDFGNTEMALLGSYYIELSAEAIQAEGFANAEEAFAALPTDVPVAASKLSN